MAKRQHYIPQFLLRNWSTDSSSINIYLLNDNIYKEKVPIVNQAQKKFYYGEDQKIENLYSQLESDTAPIIAKIINKTSLSKEDIRVLRHFVAIQNTRTPGRVQDFDDVITKMSKDLLLKSHKFDEHKKEIEEIKVNINNHQYWQLFMYLKTFLLYADLNFAILESNSNNKFIIGQDPVVITNKFLTEKNWEFSTRGIGFKGVTFFLPISPEFMICFYDREAYSFIGKKEYYQLNDDEINNLNMFQFLNTENTIYLSKFEEKFYTFNKITTSFRIGSMCYVISSPIIDNKQTVMTGSEKYPISPIQEFLGIKEQVWKLPLIKSFLVRDSFKIVQQYIKNDPKLSKVLQLEL